jgi:hypothetical protein
MDLLISDFFHSLRLSLFRCQSVNMPRDNIPKTAVKKLQQFFTKTLGR